MTDQTVPVPVDLLRKFHAYWTAIDPDAAYNRESGLPELLKIELPSPPKVGDMLDTAQQIAELPDHSVVIDADGEPWTVVGGEPMYYLDGKREGRGILVRTYGPLTLVHLGKTCD